MTALVVQDINPRVQYVATGGQTAFTFDFLAFAATDVAVYLTPQGDTPEDITQKLTYTTQYTVSLNPQPAAGGTMTLVTPATAGDVVTIVREQADQRLNFYIDGGLFTATMLNTDFDQEVLMIQQNTMYNTAITPHYNLSAPIDPVVDIYLPQLQANCVWMMNSTRTQIVSTSLVSGTVPVVQSTSSVVLAVAQAGHGLIVGNVVKCTGANTYAKAQADSASNAEVVGIVSAVADANNFTLFLCGTISVLTGLTAGSEVYLSPTVAGGYTNTRPTTATQVVKPIGIAITTTAMVWINMLGIVL